MRAALAAVDGGLLVGRFLDAHPDVLGAPGVLLRLLAVGKAAESMAAALGGGVRPQVRSGLVVAPRVGAGWRGPIVALEAAHPVPDARSVEAGRAALALAAGVGADETLVVALSGGASALAAVPAPGLSIDDKGQATAALLARGAAIDQLNCVRKHLSALKGGWLAARCPGRVVTLALSDVVVPVENDPGVIGSGPTVADPTSFGDALRAIDALDARGAVPQAVVAHLERGAAGGIVETPKPDAPGLRRAHWWLVGDRRDAMAGAGLAAERLGYRVEVIEEPTLGEARVAGERFAGRAERLARRAPGPACVIASGETTVRVRGRGRGGRNQELAVGAAAALAALGSPALVASIGTDGVDGPTDAAGGVADTGTVARCANRALGSPEAWLADNDTYRLLEALGDLLKTGPTGTNVGDLQVALFA